MYNYFKSSVTFIQGKYYSAYITFKFLIVALILPPITVNFFLAGLISKLVIKILFQESFIKFAPICNFLGFIWLLC